MKIIKIFSISVLIVFVSSIYAEEWSPNPKFNIEGSNYIETLTFVSGMSYALTETNSQLLTQGKESYICNAPKIIGSKIIIDILNNKHSGSITSEEAISSVMSGLKEKYPCQ